MLLEFSLKNLSDDLTYGHSADGVCDLLNATEFGIEYLISGANQADDYLQRGDVVKLCFKSSRLVGEDESISITLIPKIGSPTTIETALPDIITEQRITIYP